MWPVRKENVYYPTNASAFLNYDIAYAGGNAAQHDVTSLATELGARVGDFLFLSDSTCSAWSADHKCVRLTTSLIHDDRATLVRAVAGDFSIGSGNLGTVVNMGGLSYSKLYNMDPYFIRYPQQSLSGQLKTPSEVDVYIDGQKVKTLRLPPGDFDLHNITQATGYRAVDLVIRDAFGREQRISAPYYSTDVSLKAGLHEYSYNVGALRENFGTESNDYGPLAFAGFHRYGVTDALTVGVRAEGKSGRFNGGPTASDRAGCGGPAQRCRGGQRQQWTQRRRGARQLQLSRRAFQRCGAAAQGQPELHDARRHGRRSPRLRGRGHRRATRHRRWARSRWAIRRSRRTKGRTARRRA